MLCNGDLFDAIGPKDRRFDLSTLHPSVAREKDLAKAIVNLALELLMPFKDIIDVIGIGNHEETWITYGYNDPVRRVLEELGREGSTRNMDRSGATSRRASSSPATAVAPSTSSCTFTERAAIRPVTKGTIDFNRKRRNWVYDCLTFGHKHNLALRR